MNDFSTQDDIRSVVLRPGTEYAEVIELKRSFIHPSYKFPLSYNDISLSEVGRRILFDFDKYGDSPICCNQVENLEGQTALVQGFGLTESGEQSGEVPLQTNVTIISNLDCANILRHNISLNHIDKVKLIDEKNGALKHGINDALLCSTGFEEDGYFSVSLNVFVNCRNIYITSSNFMSVFRCMQLKLKETSGAINKLYINEVNLSRENKP